MNWPTVQLKYAVRFSYGDALPKEHDHTGTVRVFGSNGPYSWHSMANTKSPVIVIGRKGSYGKVNWSDKACFASDTTFFVDSSTTKQNLRWLFYVLKTLRLDHGSNEAAVPGLNRDTAYENLIYQPPVAEQRQIAGYLDRETAKIDALIAAKRRLLELLAEKRQALITQAVTRGLRADVALKDSGIEWLGEIPKHWELVKLRWFIKSLEQGWSPQADEREPGEDEWGVLKLNAVKAGQFYPANAKALSKDLEIPEKLEVKPGDFLITRANTPDLVGDICYVEKTRPYLILSDLIYRLRLKESLLSGSFLNYLLQTPIGRTQIKADARGSSSSMVKLSQGHILDWVLPLPYIEEQQEIVDYIEAKISKIYELDLATKKIISLLSERRTSLISAAVTGQLSIPA